MTSITPAPAASRRLPSIHDIRLSSTSSSFSTRRNWKHSLRRGFRRIGRYIYGVGSQFPLEKFHDYNQYRENVSTWRVAAVLSLTPLASLFTSVIPTFVPLQDPRLGLSQNPGFVCHFLLTAFYSVIGAVIQVRGVTRIPHDIFTHRDVFVISIVATIFFVGIFLGMGHFWRFPVPFTWVLAFAPWMASFSLAHVIVLRRRSLSADFRARLVGFFPSMMFQVSQIVIYPLCSAAFEVMNEWQRVGMIFIFPLLRRVVKRTAHMVVQRFTSEFELVADEASSIEVSSSIYQVMIMQTSPSALSTAMIIGFDVVQGLSSVLYFMDKRSVVPPQSIIATAFKILNRKQWVTRLPSTESLQPLRTIGKMLKCADRVRSPKISNESNIVPKVIAVQQARGKYKNVRLSHADEQIVIRHALEILNAAEVILVVEYLEIAIPTVCCCFMIIAAQFDSARYNPRISVFYHNSQQSITAVQNLGLYIALQCLSIVAMNWVMWRRYGLSASTFLAYVLECHAGSLQGKMIGWLAVLLYFPVLHYGADFKFKFELAPIDPSSV